MVCNTGESRRVGAQRHRSMIRNPLTDTWIPFETTSKLMANRPNRMKGCHTKDRIE